jgi:hypothetical protein
MYGYRRCRNANKSGLRRRHLLTGFPYDHRAQATRWRSKPAPSAAFADDRRTYFAGEKIDTACAFSQ